MVKVNCLVVILGVMGCHGCNEKKTYQDFQAQGYNLVFGNELLDVEFNMENDSLKAILLSSNSAYRDTMHLSEFEKNRVASCFFEQNISECNGLVEVNGKNLSSPRIANDIYVYKHRKKIARISVVKSYESKGFFSGRSEKGIVRFRDTVWEILNNKRKYQIANDSIMSAMKKGRFILL